MKLMDEIGEQIRKLICPIIEKNELSMVDIIVLCKHKISKTIDRDVAIKAIRDYHFLKARYAPYFDMWRPPIRKRIQRKDYINTQPKFIRMLIAEELNKILNDDKLWKRHKVYHVMLAEMELQWLTVRGA